MLPGVKIYQFNYYEKCNAVIALAVVIIPEVIRTGTLSIIGYNTY